MNETKSLQLFAIILILVVCAAFAITAFLFNAQANASTDPAQRVSIVEDQKDAAFRFIIDGKEVARIDGKGLHVRESIEYGGILVDVGAAEYDARNTAQVEGGTHAPQ